MNEEQRDMETASSREARAIAAAREAQRLRSSNAVKLMRDMNLRESPSDECIAENSRPPVAAVQAQIDSLYVVVGGAGRALEKFCDRLEDAGVMVPAETPDEGDPDKSTVDMAIPVPMAERLRCVSREIVALTRRIEDLMARLGV
jgi:hypothetical protein